MTINFKTPDIRELKPRILVIGVGGAGGNAVNRMITAGMIPHVGHRSHSQGSAMRIAVITHQRGDQLTIHRFAQIVFHQDRPVNGTPTVVMIGIGKTGHAGRSMGCQKTRCRPLSLVALELFCHP